MKNKNLFLSICLLVGTTISFAQVQKMNSVKVGGTTTINSSAAFEVESNTKGFLPPRMTNTEMQAIVNPVDGLMVYNTTLGCLAYYKSGSFNCTDKEPAPLGNSYIQYSNGITGGVSVNNALSSYTTGETFNQNTTCKSKTISAQGCGGLSQVTGVSGTVYPLVNINGQCWFRTNLNEIPTNFANYTATSWLNTDTADQGYWGYYNTATPNGTAGWGTTSPGANLGYLYQWKAAMNNSNYERAQGACPIGFHVPSDCEWMYLEHGQGMALSEQVISNYWRSNITDNQGTPGYKLLSEGTGQTNASGFSGLLAGFRPFNGLFVNRASNGYWWSSSSLSDVTAINRDLSTNYRGVDRGSNFKASGFSVRCLKD